MNKEALQESIGTSFPELQFAPDGEWLNVEVPAEQLLQVMQHLRNNADLNFDYLFCVTCIDWKTNLTMVYHLSSTQYRHQLVIKSVLNREKPEIETVAFIWKTAEMLEREVFELFGVHFLHHPDLRKLILPDDWVGFPLRKDYEDPINMIKL